MQHLGLTRAELRIYHRTLRYPHTLRIRVAVLNLEGEQLASISPRVLDGQIVVDRRGPVKRVLTMTFLDPKHALNFDSDSPDDGALYRDRMLRVYYSVRVPDLGKHVTAVPFTGPVVKFSRQGATVTVEAHSKERQAMGNLWRPLTLKKGTPKVDAIQTIMERTGETEFRFPSLKSRLPKTRSLGRMAKPWNAARRIARSMDRQLFYDGRGTLHLRQMPSKVGFTFNAGPQGEVVGEPSITVDMDGFKNKILMVGGKPKGAKHRVRGHATAPDRHPLSPVKLGRNGEPYYEVERRENDHLRSKKECHRRAERILEDRLRASVDVAFDSVPIPHLDEGDLVRLRTVDGTVVEFRLDRFVLPLTTPAEGGDGPTMTVGYLKRRYPNRRAIRHGGRR